MIRLLLPNWMLPIVRPLRPTFREVVLLSLFVNLLALAVPVFVLQVYDRVVFHAGLTTLQGLVIGMALVLLFDFILRQTRSRIMQTVALRLDVQVGRQLYEKLVNLPLRVLENRPAVYWRSLFRDAEVIRNTLSGSSAVLVCDMPFLLLFVGLIFVIATPIAWVLLIVLPLFILMALRSSGTLAAATQRERDVAMARDALVGEVVEARTTVKALGLDPVIRPAWEDRQADTLEAAVHRGSRADSYGNAGIVLTMVTTVLLTTVGAVAIINQELTIGALIATNMLVGRLLTPFNQLVGTWRSYAAFRQAAHRVGEVLAMDTDRIEGEVALPRPRGGITMEDVSFAYEADGPAALSDIRLRIRDGGLHAVVGRNGSGKTTFLKMIQGLYAPASGRVLLDDADISQFSRADMARWIGYVPQDGMLFAGTIRDNIVARKPDADDAEVIRAAEMAGVHSFIIDLPDGYATDIGEAGGRLSAGQRQRIAVARALIGDPPVLLMDEPNASLDREAEENMRAMLTSLAEDHAVIVVTHSPVLLSACESVIALERGKVALAGPSHDILPKLFGQHRAAPPLQTKAGGQQP